MSGEYTKLSGLANVSLAETPASICSFGEYRRICDKFDNFRRVGIADPGIFEEVVRDSRTLFCRIRGTLCPVAADVSFDHGYDAERSRELLDGLPTMVLTVPFDRVMAGDLRKGNVYGGDGLPDEYAIVVASPKKLRGFGGLFGRRSKLVAGLGDVRIKSFIRPEIPPYPPYHKHRTAWMGLYACTVEPRNNGKARGEAPTFSDVWREHCMENDIDVQPPRAGERVTGTYLLTCGQLASHDNSRLLGQLWDITAEGFGRDKLGAHHPVSMEEGGRHAFEDMITAPKTYTAVHYANGKPVCFGSMTLDLGSWHWINRKSTAIINFTKLAERDNADQVFFSALVSSVAGAGYSRNILGLFFELAGRRGKAHQAYFESTNWSSLGVPRIATRTVERSEFVRMMPGRDIKLVDIIHYGALVVNRKK